MDSFKITTSVRRSEPKHVWVFHKEKAIIFSAYMHTSYSESDQILEDQLFSKIFILLNTTTTGNNSNSGIFTSQDRYRSVSFDFIKLLQKCHLLASWCRKWKNGFKEKLMRHYFFHPLNISVANTSILQSVSQWIKCWLVFTQLLPIYSCYLIHSSTIIV